MRVPNSILSMTSSPNFITTNAVSFRFSAGLIVTVPATCKSMNANYSLLIDIAGV